MIGLAVLSYCMYEILKMYCGIFFLFKSIGKLRTIFEFHDEPKKLRLLTTSQLI